MQPAELAKFIASLAKDHDDLDARLRVLSHTAQSSDKNVTIHANFLSFRVKTPTVEEFVDILSFKLVPFCLHRKHIEESQKDWSKLPPSKIQESAIRLHQQAVDLFKRANKKTNRNGEFGELVTYLLIERTLRAPQFLAKMSLKTSPQMPVHGSDGIHLGYDPTSDQLKLYWGESKCYSSIQSAINQAAKSIAENLKHDKMGHEIFLVEQYFDLSGFPAEAKKPILTFLDPYNESYNKRIDVSVVFIAFDFDVFSKLNKIPPSNIEQEFSKQLGASLPSLVQKLDASLKLSGVEDHSVEVFFLPLPSVKDMRTYFQNKIGWSK